jgi:hypothetical protein
MSLRVARGGKGDLFWGIGRPSVHGFGVSDIYRWEVQV